MNLVIVESPTKARTLGKFLPSKDYTVVASVGHVQDLPKSKLGIDVEKNFEPEWTMVKGKREVMRKIRSEGLKAKQILLATDPDREGEAISWHIYQLLKDNKKFPLEKKQVKRITFHEITKEAIVEAIEHGGELNKDLFDAQQARRVIDRLVGYQVSPVLWKKIRRGLSAGRVQSVALRLIVEKEQERDEFNPVEYWQIVSELKPGQKKDSFLASLDTINNKKAEVGTEKQAMQVLAELDASNYQVKNIDKKESRRRPSAPFTTSTLQQTAGQKLGWTAKNTMRNAQSLYEKGLITYHRTDSTNIAVKALKALRTYIPKKYGKKYLHAKERVYKTKAKVAQEAHEAIRPTDISKTPKSLGIGEYETRLYRLIWQRFVASQMADAIFDKTKIEIEAKLDANSKRVYGLSTEGKTMKFEGWLTIFGKDYKDDVLPEVEQAQNLDLIEVTGNQRFTEPPARYSEPTLIKKLEDLGIGRPSTYASIMSTIQDRGYVEKEEGRLKPTAIGITTNTFLVEHFGNEVDYQFTAKMEDSLDEIANGEKKWKPVIKEFYTPFKKHVDEAEKADRMKVPVESTGKQCPDCLAKHQAGELEKDDIGDVVVRTGKFGKFLSCSRFPDCKYTNKYEDKIGVACPECGDSKKGEVIIKKTRKGRKFYGCNRYPDCKFVSWKKPKKEKG